MAEELKDCPICASTHLYERRDNGRRWTLCKSCLCRGPSESFVRRPSPAGGTWRELDATFSKMLEDRFRRQKQLLAMGINTGHNEGWIDALEHVLGIMRLRPLLSPPEERE